MQLYKGRTLVLKKHLKSTVTRVYVMQVADNVPYTTPTAFDRWSPVHLMMAAIRLNIEKGSNLIFLLHLVSLQSQFRPNMRSVTGAGLHQPGTGKWHDRNVTKPHT